MIRVKVYQDGECVQRTDLRADDLIIGRDENADIQLPSPAVSRRHARLTRTDAGWQVADLGAANGVFVQRGESSPTRVVIEKVAEGDLIIIEKFSIRLRELDDTVRSQEVNSMALEASTDILNSRTQFISMNDVLKANEGAPQSGMSGAPTSGPVPSAPPLGAWWVRIRSEAGHDRTFMLTEEQAVAGAAATSRVRLPVGPPELLRLEKSGNAVALQRIAKWPFPRVTVENRAVKSGLLQHGEAFSVGEVTVSVHTDGPPKRGGLSDG